MLASSDTLARDQRDQEFTGNRIAFLRHRARAAGSHPPDSRTSATSVCASKRISCPILPRLAVTRESHAANSASESRCVCQGMSGTPRFNSPASAFWTGMPCSPNAASVPTAPPNWTTTSRGMSFFKTFVMSQQWREPNGNLQAKGDGQRLLRVSAPAINVSRCFRRVPQARTIRCNNRVRKISSACCA